mgnify:CR=1 FL=1
MKSKQTGLTMITWLIIIALVGIQAIMALRIIPVYLNYGTVKNIMEDLAEDPDARGKTPREVKSLILNRLQINNLYELKKQKNAFKFKPQTDGMIVDLHYEARGPIYGNLEFIATFDHQVVIPK